jgi:hypothetical protein
MIKSFTESADVDHPLIYCNGDSYSDENFHPTLKNQTYAHVVGQYLQGFVINNAISGSCNRRIIRTSVHDLVNERKLNPDQQIIALIGLSFELRSELWNENKKTVAPAESNFENFHFTKELNWQDMLLKGMDIVLNKHRPDQDFFDKVSQGRAYYYSPYAERTNLLCDLLMFQSLMQQLNIKFLIFQSPMAEKLKSEYLIDFFKSTLNSKNFLDFETFGFINWCNHQGFEPLDFKDRPEIGHYGIDAHRAFAEQILIPHLEKL